MEALFEGRNWTKIQPVRLLPDEVQALGRVTSFGAGLLGEIMSKAAAIDIAVRLQLAADKNQARDLTGRLGSTPAAGGAAAIDALYDQNSVRGFLANVAFRLRADTPPLIFNWAALDPASCLSDNLWVLERAIADNTTEMPTAEAKDTTK
jgi:hypothetical protein